MNQICLVGRITKDPELRQSSQGTNYCMFTLAVNRPYSNKDGNTEADFISCVAWRNSAEFLANYIKKGDLLSVIGRLQVRVIEQSPNYRTVTDVLVNNVQALESKAKRDARQDYGYEPEEPSYSKNKKTSFEEDNLDDLDFPDYDDETTPY